jgi:Zn ribbon nucleic-acid-binding protein
MFEFQSTVVCPACGHQETERMHEDAQQYFYKCKGCGKVLKPIKGDCCVFCSYADTPCPTTQMHTGRRENAASAQSWFLIKEEGSAPV